MCQVGLGFLFGDGDLVGIYQKIPLPFLIEIIGDILILSF
jgi:hypothetical protein